MFKEIVSALGIFLPSFATRALYRLVGHKIGKNARLPFLSYIHAEHIDIGNDVDIREFVFIRVGKLSIGNNTIVSFGTQIKGNKTFLSKGNNFIGAHCLINCEEDVTLGFYSGLGPRCTVYTHGSFLPVTKGYPAKFEKIVLEDYVWIAMAVTILPGTHIESNCIINPGVVLKSKIKSNSLIEIKPAVFSTVDLNKLQKFMTKNNLQQMRNIISGFSNYFQMDLTHNEEDNSFSSKENYIFRYFPEKNAIELTFDIKEKITYDLENFRTDYSKREEHRKFLFFLRRRCGITLQTNYDK